MKARNAPLPAALAAAALVVALLASCTPPATIPSPAATAPSPSPAMPDAQPPLRPTGAATTIASGLAAPWSMVVLDSGSALVSERDSARILEVGADGSVREVAVVSGVVPGGEGGLLGLALADLEDGTWLYAYLTTADDNRIVRYALRGEAGSYTLGTQEVVLSGIRKGSNHNGGRIAFGPDGRLYATTGDAGVPELAQDPVSLNGKILRLEPDGAVPADNPFPGSPTWSYGHRNPQGIAWDDGGQLWASEFGQDTWDEFNRIVAGGNYGWLAVEGVGGDAAYVDPVTVWSTDEASPSGLAAIDGTFFLAALRGERLWVLNPGLTEPQQFLAGDLGRIRDVAAGPDGSLWILTSNTDGRGSPRDGDDRILRFELTARP